MLNRRQLLGLGGAVAVAGAGAAAWRYYGPGASYRMAGGPFRPYPFDPVTAANFGQKLFIPVASGPFGVLDVAGPLKLRATAASFTLLPGRESPFLLYQTENLLKLTVAAGKRVAAKWPATLSQVKPVRTEGAAGAAGRKIELSMQGMRFLINGRTFRMEEIAFEVKRGAVEIWSISNPSIGMPHPMHLHGFSFQVIERLNSPPQLSATARFGNGRTVSDLGWKDTVLVWPGETVRIAIDFAHDFPGSQTYLFHCHNLEHEDAGMMINFRVVA